MPDIRLNAAYRDAQGIVHAFYIGSKFNVRMGSTKRFLLCTDESLYQLRTQRGLAVNCIECIARLSKGASNA